MFANIQDTENNSSLLSKYPTRDITDFPYVAGLTRNLNSSNRLALNFQLPTADGQHVRLSDYRGFKVVLAFGATWGRLCQAQLPVLARLSRESNVIVLVICSGETLHSIDAFVNEHNVPFPVLNDYSNEVKRQYSVTCLPTTLYVDEQGRIVGTHRGEIDEDILNCWLANVSPVGTFQ